MKNREPSFINQIFNYEVVLITAQDLRDLKSAASPKKGFDDAKIGFNEGLLIYTANSELCSTVGLALCLDEHDVNLHSDQERFNSAYLQFRDTIAALHNPVLRSSVALPSEYVQSIEDNFLLSYARPREGGRPVDWRKDEFYLRLLTLYRMISGQNPAVTPGGPTIRFMRVIVNLLRERLEGEAEKLSNEFVLVDALWRIPRNETFLKEWFRSKKDIFDVQGRIEQSVGQHVAAYERRLSLPSAADNIVYGNFGSEKDRR